MRELRTSTLRPARVIHVCDDIACLTRGAGAICEEFRNSGFQTVNSIGNGYFEDYLNA